MEKLDVFMDRERLGEIRLADSQPGMELVYAESWLKGGGFPISPHLQPGASSSNSLEHFLSNLLPEGEWLEELSRNAACSKGNIFGLIAYMGAETAGALSFVQDGSDDLPETSFREIPAAELTERIATRATKSIMMWDEKPRLSVAGVQEKLLVMIRPDGVMGLGDGNLASTHLLKLGKEPEMHLVLNEYICMRLGAAVGLPVAEVALKRFGEPVLAVRRFDRQWRGDRVLRLHIIDGCQLLDLPPKFKYERPFHGKDVTGYRPGASLPRLFAACRAYCSIPVAAVKGMLDWTLFQLIIGNSDAHGKNVSFYVGSSGISLAPAYDLLSLDLYDFNRDLAMAVGDCFNPDEVSTYPLAEMCEECNLPQRQVGQSLQKLCENTLRAAGVIASDVHSGAVPGVTTEEKNFADRLLARIEENAKRLQKVGLDLPKIRL